MSQLTEKGFVERGFLGIVHLNVTPSIAAEAGIPVEYGIGIVSLVEEGPADQALLEAGDIIVRLNDEELKNSADLIRILTRYLPGDTLNLEYYREGAKFKGQITLGKRPR